MKILKFWYDLGEERSYNTVLHITKKLSFKKGSYNGLMFSINGLGLNKFEREVFNSKFLKVTGAISIYLGKLIISYHNDDLERQYQNVNVYYTKSLNMFLKNQIKHAMENVKEKIADTINHISFKKQYNFTADRYFEGMHRFKTDMLSAFQLATNYEMDLYVGAKLIFSPLAFEYEENEKAIKKYLGVSFLTEDGFNLKGYKDWNSKYIKIIK